MLFARRCRSVGSGALLTAIFLVLNSCAEGLAPLSKVPAPAELVVEAVRLGAMRLTWAPVPDADVVGYAIERRANLSGPFLPLVDQIPQTNLTQAVYLDTDVEPETYYGYRLYTVTRYGDRSTPSVVAGTKSPPLPGIEVRTASLFPSAESVDPDGYELTIVGPDTVRQTIGVSATRRFAPLRPGQYQVALGGVIDRCASDGQGVRSVNVSDSTAETIVPVVFQVTCRDPSRGDIAVTVTSTGASLDGEHTVELLGEASDAALPDSARIIARTQSIGSPSGSTRFTNLRPGTFDVTLAGLASNCQLDGAATRTVSLTALETKDVRFNVSCSSPTGGGGLQGPGYQYRAAWTSLASGEYALDLRIDMTTFNRAEIDDTMTNGISGDPLTGAQLTVAYDASRLAFNRFEAASAPNINAEPTVNGSTPGFVSMLAGTTVLKTGDMGIVRIIFIRVPGSPIGVVTTVTTLQSVTSRSAGTTRVVTGDVRITEGTLTIAAGGGGPSNQSPVAKANGPYTGTLNTAFTLSSAGSTDADGTIASYSWALGNGQTATGASPSVTYGSAGTYTAVLTVTDNQGATDTDQATVTITGGVAANQLPVAEANGPYTAAVNAAFSLSSTGSSDPDGTIATYSWALGNGQTAAGASPSVNYSSAGTYTAVLTVTDDKGATDTDQATITISEPGGGTPNPGYQYRAAWTSLTNGEFALDLRIDMRTFNRADVDDITTAGVSGDPLTGAQLSLAYDAARLAFNRVEPTSAPFINAEPTVNGSTAGVVNLLAGTTVLKTGDMGIARIIFTRVAGSAAGTVTTATTLQSVTTRSAGSTRVITGDVRITEGTLTIGGGGGGPANQVPVAEANGPYSGTVSTAFSLSSAGSADPDGTIASYSWALGNGQTVTGASPSVTYSAAGTYTAVLTVTDNQGATDTDQATVTIAGGATPNQPPVAQANGPYNATAGVAITLSSAGSSDSDGAIASYSWALGNGQSATGASPVVTYASAGTYAVVLTVTDDDGATSTDQATVTVTSATTTKPLSWRNVYGPIDVVNNQVAITVSYDMRGNVPETPGIEVLSTFKVDSLKWDPAVLQFSAINLGPNIIGTSNQANAAAGNLAFQGSVSGAQAQGLITIATIRFKLVGTPGSRTTTVTALGLLLGAPVTGDFVYNSKTAIIEGEFTTP